MSSELDLTRIGTAAQIQALRAASFPDLDNDNFLVAMKIAKRYDLDPFAKEIWGWQQQGKTMIVVSNTGYMRIARQQEGFISIQAQAVFEGDEFSIDFASNEYTHKVDITKRSKGAHPLGAYAVLEYITNGERRKNIKFVLWEEYYKASKYGDALWDKNKSAMISKVATTVLCREVYGLSGLYTEEEITKSETIEEQKAVTRPDLSKIQFQIPSPQEEGTTTLPTA